MGKKKEIENETNNLIEKNSNDIIKNYKLREEEFNIDIQNLKNLLAEREKHKDELVNKLEGKVYKVKNYIDGLINYKKFIKKFIKNF
jgi:hypothetical protein